MANTAADLPEELSASQGCGRRGEHSVSRWNHSAAYELSEVVDVSQAQAIWLIFRVLGCLENCGSFRGAQPVSDAYLVEIGLLMSRVGCRVDLSSRRGRRGSVRVPRKSEPARFPRECDHLSGRL